MPLSTLPLIPSPCGKGLRGAEESRAEVLRGRASCPADAFAHGFPKDSRGGVDGGT